MWYRDIAERLAGREDYDIAVNFTAGEFDCSLQTATEIVYTATDYYARGLRGAPIREGCTHRNEYHDRAALKDLLSAPSRIERFGGVDQTDLAALLLDAWTDGIQRKNRVTLHLDNQTPDACCDECGQSLNNGAEECDHCDSTDIHHNVSVTVHDPYAARWADGDQSIDGSSWESTDNGDMVYTVLTDRPGLADELSAEGYRLDLTEYA